jgi:hypothetical protein
VDADTTGLARDAEQIERSWEETLFGLPFHTDYEAGMRRKPCVQQGAVKAWQRCAQPAAFPNLVIQCALSHPIPEVVCKLIKYFGSLS